MWRTFGRESWVLGIGVVLALSTANQAGSIERIGLERRFTLEVERLGAELDRRLDGLAAGLVLLQRASGLRGGLSRAEFAQLGAALRTDHPYVEEVAFYPVVEPEARPRWLARVREEIGPEFGLRDADGREVEADRTLRPLLHRSPEPAPEALGRHRGEDPVFDHVARQVTRSGRVGALPTETKLRRDGSAGTSGVLLAAVYAPGSAPFVEVGRVRGVRGHLVLRFDADRLLDAVLGGPDAGARFRIFAEPARRLVAGTVPRQGEVLTVDRPLAHPAEEWRLVGAAREDWFDAREGWGPTGRGLAVIVASGIAALGLRRRRRELVSPAQDTASSFDASAPERSRPASSV